jgi:cytochrome oxidase assembly protein ShyY1
LDSSKTGEGMTPEQVSAATHIHPSAVQRPRSRIRLLLLAICAGIVFFGFLALGTWQVYRLQWKLNLIERVNQRVHAPAIPATGESKRAAEFHNEKPDAEGQANVVGLLRISEPGGGFLRKNDPAADRWYSRDVQAIAASRKLSNVAPYFIDAEAAPRPASEAGKRPTDYPIAGLTVIAFHNSHLVYALTWYALALMVAGGWLWAAREQKRRLADLQAERV